MKRKYGWLPDTPDHRDYIFKLEAPVTLPPFVDLRGLPILDQGDLGSCTANAIASAYYFDLVKQGKKLFDPSRLFIYYNERKIEGSTSSDSGAMIRDGFKSINIDGVCSELLWKYNISKFAKKPTAKCYASGKIHHSLEYRRINRSMDDMKGCLASGFPFVIGFSVYESFENIGPDGIMPMPLKSEQLLGGHAVLVVGYDDQLQRWIVQNSWGVSWGVEGCFYMPYQYLMDSNLSDDFWTVKTVTK